MINSKAFSFCTDIGYLSVNKHGEQLCGDHVELVEPDESTVVFVLADGLGSGVKASILSTLTSKIISTMMANFMSLEECVSAVAATLPICEVRKVAYSTFTIIRVTDNKEAEIIQYDNPQVIMLRDGKNFDYPKTISQIDGKTIYRSKIALKLDDTFIATSDGAVYAGVGKSLNFGWQRDNIIEYMEKVYDREYTAKALASLLLDECVRLYGGSPGDDTTVGVIKIREREQVNLMIGPPSDPADLNKMMTLFFSKGGRHIVCGGTTSTLTGQFLGKPVIPCLDYISPDVPPMAKIEGVDIVTEGVITISKVLDYAKDYLSDNKLYDEWSIFDDGASQIARMLFESATDINFYVGRAINAAHQNPNLPITFNIKMQLVDELSQCLKKMGKKIKVSYF